MLFDSIGESFPIVVKVTLQPIDFQLILTSTFIQGIKELLDAFFVACDVLKGGQWLLQFTGLYID